MKNEAIEAWVYISTNNNVDWYMCITNLGTGMQSYVDITKEQKETLVKEGIPVL